MTFERELGGWSFITCEGAGHYAGGHFQNLVCFGGSFSDIKGALLGGLDCYESGF